MTISPRPYASNATGSGTRRMTAGVLTTTTVFSPQAVCSPVTIAAFWWIWRIPESLKPRGCVELEGGQIIEVHSAAREALLEDHRRRSGASGVALSATGMPPASLNGSAVDPERPVIRDM